MLLPLYIVALVVSSFNNKSSNYFNGDINSSSISGNINNYMNLLEDEKDFVEEAAINAKVITKNHVNVFFVLNDDVDDHIFQKDSTLKPKKDIRGFTSDMIVINDSSWKQKDSLRQRYMSVLNSIYKVYIDTTLYESEFIYTRNIKKQRGFETFVSLKNLDEGKHTLQLIRLKERKEKNDTFYFKKAKIPFWYYPD